VIPVRDRFEFLNETIASIYSQTRLPDEVLVVDDCSVTPLEEFFKENPPPGPVKVVRNERSRNVGGARNFGFKHASGDLIAFNDSDDLWEPDKVRLQAEYLESHPDVDGVYGPMMAFFPDGSTLPWAHDRPPVVDSASALLGANMTTQTLMIRRDAWERLGGFDETLTNLSDQVFSIEAGRAGLQIVFLSSIVVTRHRIHDNRLTCHQLKYFLCGCRIAIRYRHLSSEFFGPGSVRIHLSRILKQFGVKVRYLRFSTQVLGGVLCLTSPRSHMPRM
jgi:glycosyltransferase involved in cell wall biosynthesis